MPPKKAAHAMAVERQAYEVRRGVWAGRSVFRREVLRHLFSMMGFLVGPLVHQGGRYDFHVRRTARVGGRESVCAGGC